MFLFCGGQFVFGKSVTFRCSHSTSSWFKLPLSILCYGWYTLCIPLVIYPGSRTSHPHVNVPSSPRDWSRNDVLILYEQIHWHSTRLPGRSKYFLGKGNNKVGKALWKITTIFLFHPWLVIKPWTMAGTSASWGCIPVSKWLITMLEPG